ncbi:MAG: hypothetical protein FWF35_01625 [Elusimicrobia bacterium]|nr:hypothetical protein [Elusimicrobiota bacterium]
MKKLFLLFAALSFAAGAGAMDYVQFDFNAQAQYMNLLKAGQQARPKADRPTGGSTHIYSSDEIKSINAMLAQNEKAFKYYWQQITGITQTVDAAVNPQTLEEQKTKAQDLDKILMSNSDKVNYFMEFANGAPDYNKVVKENIQFFHKQLVELDNQISGMEEQLQNPPDEQNISVNHQTEIPQ